MPTVADVLKRIERIKKDLEYVRTFQDKWKEQRERFPKIYEGILEQERFFLRRIEELKGLRVDAMDALGSEAENTPAPAPAIVPGAEAPPPVQPDSGDEKRAAAINDIGEKLRKRAKGDKPDGSPIALAPEPVAADAGK